MAGKVFRIVAAFTMLVLYTSVMAASDVMALTCHCNTHSGDVHTAFNHVHKCDSESCSHHHDGAESADSSTSQLAKNRCCNHNHSNDIALYIQPRTNEDDHAEWQTSLLAIVTDVVNYSGVQEAESGGEEYGQYLLPALLDGYACGGTLRAPPALV